MEAAAHFYRCVACVAPAPTLRGASGAPEQSSDQAGRSTHNAGFTEYPFPRELFEKFIAENDGPLVERRSCPRELTVSCFVAQATFRSDSKHFPRAL